MLTENLSHTGPKGSKDDQGASASLNDEEKQSSEPSASRNTAGYYQRIFARA